MSTLRVNLPGREYDIVCQKGILDKAGSLLRPILKGKLAAIVTDSNVEPLYAARVARSLHLAGFQVALLEIPAGETSKCPEVLCQVWEQLMDVGLTRTDAVIALGGGVVGDLAGFAAATILRGVDFVQIPTTLLAQVDSSVGGKVAVDLEAGKNLAGAFYQPKMVIMDPDCLNTLPNRVFSDGMAEVIKYGCIWDRAFFDHLAALGSRKAIMEDIESVLLRCCDIKRQVVEQDERDTGLRMLLNFGHTVGHVYEKAYHYETYTHGEAVAAGMVVAASLGTALGITPPEAKDEISALLRQFGLPTEISATPEDYRSTLVKDKKSQGSRIHLVVLEEIGKAKTLPLEQSRLLNMLG
ncbi:MAG: 3-dehydroquinate synthase [Oscillospiraceae bacterium]|nr:3-dehydroquinate synthase [Oscillospiraceae bacterium]